jgi:nitroimidazol reductase NimA-like FMN-containing flavoprotein (pyridoxamine 5'-phosphate oxidase superfamily)
VARQLTEVERHSYDTACHLDSDSVMCFGAARIIEDLDERAAALNEFNRAFVPDSPDIPPKRVEGCCVVEISIEEMTGRRERSKDTGCTFWREQFETPEAR